MEKSSLTALAEGLLGDAYSASSRRSLCTVHDGVEFCRRPCHPRRPYVGDLRDDPMEGLLGRG